jgi:hypothetical protein
LISADVEAEAPTKLAYSDQPRWLCLAGGVSAVEDGVADSLKVFLLCDRYNNEDPDRGLVKPTSASILR